jgi:hypothetical protein
MEPKVPLLYSQKHIKFPYQEKDQSNVRDFILTLKSIEKNWVYSRTTESLRYSCLP